MSFKSSVNASAFKRPKIFSSAYVRKVIESDGVILNTTSDDFSDNNLSSTSSFRYDSPGAGLKSTQQLPVDWSLFANHTFFNSAEAKVNIAFDKIINEYPFDGTNQEFEEYIDSLTGYEKWVLDQFPTNRGFLIFPSNSSGYITVKDFAGTSFINLSKNKTGDKILDPLLKSYTIEMHLFLTGTSNLNQVVCQNIRNDGSAIYGYTIGVDESVSDTTGTVFFSVSSGSSIMSASINVPKESFNHLAFTHNRKPGQNIIQIYKDGDLLVTSSNKINMGLFGFTSQSFTIGHGDAHRFEGAWSPAQSLQGAIDEFRFFQDVRTSTSLKRYAKKNISASDSLKLYFKFNEPTGSLGDLTNIILDSSGNSLHSYITNFTGSMRATASFPVSNPITYELAERNPILFPSYAEVVDLNETLLYSASLYDSVNPNLITKLIPKHYLEEGQANEGFASDDGDIADDYSGTGIPGTGKLGSTHLLISLLYTWAKHFDEIKMFIDHFSNILSTDYEEDNNTAASSFLPFIFKYYGFDIPSFFSNTDANQFFSGEDIGLSHDYSSVPLQSIQNQLWRRILVNLNEIIQSKGTLHSIKSFLRAIGINPDNSLRIREFGSEKIRSLNTLRQTKTEVSTLLDMSGTLAPVTASINIQGIPDIKPFLISSYLSSSRVEVGYPFPRGTFVSQSTYPMHGISNASTDGLFTSGSWSYEAIYKFENLMTGSHYVTQSLVRFATTGSSTAHQIWANLVAISGSATDDADAKIKLFAKTSPVHVSASLLELELTGVNIFDGKQWNISFGRFRHDDPSLTSVASSSWFLRAGYQQVGELKKTFSTASYVKDTLAVIPSDTTDSILARVSGDYNRSGSFFLIGSQSLNTAGSPTFLNNTGSVTESLARYTNFSGKVGHISFWTKGLSLTEWTEHVRNFKTKGVADPLTNFNFVTQESGSFERLRVDLTTDQPVTDSNASGQITIFDFSQNNLSMAGTGFEYSTQVIKPESFYFSMLSSKFDESATNNKVRVRGYQSDLNIERFNAQTAPVYEITPSEMPVDDTRFSIDFSITDALNEDIVKIFSTFDSLDNIIGNPELIFSDDYPELANLREVYFNRLTSKINLKGFFEFFKWFDSSIGMFIEQLIPRKTNFLGTNYVIESHALERSKVRYHCEDIYLEETLRRTDATTVITEPGSSIVG